MLRLSPRGEGRPLPAALEGLLEETLNRVADLIVDDAQGDQFPDLLTVEERP